MSTSATATAREPDDQPRINRWLKYIEEEDDSSAGNTIPIEHPTTGTVLSFDLARVERLVGQLEARSLALVKHQYVEPPQPSRPRYDYIVIISALVAIWLGTLALAFAYFFYDHVQRRVGDQGPIKANRTVSTLGSNEQKLTTQVDQLAKSLAPSSGGLKRLESAVERSKDP
jgi:hypothetical protein